MDFTVEVCENFFDYSRDLNRSNGIVSRLYKIMLQEKRLHPEIFEGIERRLSRASSTCLKAEEFIQLIKTGFRNLVVPFNAHEESVYVALMFYMSEVIFDQARLYISGIALEEIKTVIINLMVKKSKEEFGFDTRAKWYKFTSGVEEKKNGHSVEDNFDYTAFLFGIGLTYLMTKV